MLLPGSAATATTQACCSGASATRSTTPTRVPRARTQCGCCWPRSPRTTLRATASQRSVPTTCRGKIHSTVPISSRLRAIITASASTPATTRSTPTGSSTAVRRRPSCRAAASTTSRFRKACCLMTTCSAQAWATAAQVGARRAGMSACRASNAGRSRWGSTFGPGGITSASRHLTTRAAAISARLTRQASRRTPTTLCRPRGSTPKHTQWYTCSPTGTSTKGS